MISSTMGNLVKKIFKKRLNDSQISQIIIVAMINLQYQHLNMLFWTFSAGLTKLVPLVQEPTAGGSGKLVPFSSFCQCCFCSAQNHWIKHQRDTKVIKGWSCQHHVALCTANRSTFIIVFIPPLFLEPLWRSCKITKTRNIWPPKQLFLWSVIREDV